MKVKELDKELKARLMDRYPETEDNDDIGGIARLLYITPNLCDVQLAVRLLNVSNEPAHIVSEYDPETGGFRRIK